jgi:ATP-binding cassette subfamily B protein/subfamily B ATP-binding cassette protein MsbA
VWWWSRLIEVAWAVLIPVASAAVLVYGGTQVVRGNLTIGDVMMFSTYLLMLLGPLETLTSTAANIQGNLAGLDRVLDLLNEPTEFASTDAQRLRFFN